MAFRQTFDTPYEQHADRRGQTFSLLRKITKDNLRFQPDAKEFDAKVLPMYGIQFPDGTKILAWPEEVELP
jgi:hypothetical protein